jgi:hypothetical protein
MDRALLLLLLKAVAPVLLLKVAVLLLGVQPLEMVVLLLLWRTGRTIQRRPHGGMRRLHDMHRWRLDGMRRQRLCIQRRRSVQRRRHAAVLMGPHRGKFKLRRKWHARSVGRLSNVVGQLCGRKVPMMIRHHWAGDQAVVVSVHLLL